MYGDNNLIQCKHINNIPQICVFLSLYTLSDHGRGFHFGPGLESNLQEEVNFFANHVISHTVVQHS